MIVSGSFNYVGGLGAFCWQPVPANTMPVFSVEQKRLSMQELLNMAYISGFDGRSV
jgi:hypothetical protein